MNYEATTIKPLLEMQNRGEIKVVTFNQLIDEWKTKYNSVAHLYMQGTAAVDAASEAKIVSHYSLSATPNPFNPSTTIRFSLPQGDHVVLKVFDTMGREVAMLLNDRAVAGEHAVRFDGAGLSSGVYIHRLMTSTYSQSKSMLLFK